jgi:hypothetical protein
VSRVPTTESLCACCSCGVEAPSTKGPLRGPRLELRRVIAREWRSGGCAAVGQGSRSEARVRACHAHPAARRHAGRHPPGIRSVAIRVREGVRPVGLEDASRMASARIRFVLRNARDQDASRRADQVRRCLQPAEIGRRGVWWDPVGPGGSTPDPTPTGSSWVRTSRRVSSRRGRHPCRNGLPLAGRRGLVLAAGPIETRGPFVNAGVERAARASLPRHSRENPRSSRDAR